MDRRLRLHLPWRRLIMLGAVWGISIWSGLVLARSVFEFQPETLSTTIFWLGESRWMWPLVGAAGIVVLTSSRVRRRWPSWTRRVQLSFAVAIGLAALGVPLTVWPQRTLLGLGVVSIVGLLAAWIVAIPRRLAPPVPPEVLEGISDHRERLGLVDARVKLRNDLRTTALQAIAGLAVLAGAVLAFQQLTEDRQQAAASRELTLQGQASERFTRAIDQLGSDRREVQLGGIYGLEQIAEQAPANRLAVTEVLVAYLHRRVPRPAKPPAGSTAVDELRLRAPDAQAALTVLGRRQIERDDPPLDLRGLDLRHADLLDASFYAADFRGTDLGGANLSNAAIFNANFNGVNLRDAVLHKANLELTTLEGADLHGADLTGAEMFYASIRDADLRDADLSGADLDLVELGGANLRMATADPSTKWPSGFDWAAAGIFMSR